jgi:ferredoxin
MISRGGRYVLKSANLKIRLLSATVTASQKVDGVNITFQEGKKGEKIFVRAQEGKKVLDVALDHNIDIEGACGGELACSTCHVILTKELYDRLPPKTEEESDMLDLAWGLTDTSRLCCQLTVTKELEGANFIVPDETNEILNKKR